VVEVSLDFANWTEIDGQANKEDLKDGWGMASFPVSNSTECRFIRLTQTDKRHCHGNYLTITAFEVFATLLE
jgi:hypothetical protein